MNFKRDNFTKSTTDVLAKRVAYLCSNPSCRRVTIGAHELSDKSVSIGEAAHITAASSGGPRYDDTLTPEQRSHIDNGIWMCSNCATLIDKDILKYTVDLLREWKRSAETESKKKLSGEIATQPRGLPNLEIDLIYTTRGRSNRGYSGKNPVEKVEGKYIMYLPTNNPIIYWELFWNFNFVIFNNSSYPAFNVKIESVGAEDFSQLDTLPNVNNLPPLMNIDVKAKVKDFIEGDYVAADRAMKTKIPDKFRNLKLKLSYSDETQNIHSDYFEFSESGMKKCSA